MPQASAKKKKRSKECALMILAGDIENEQSFLLLHELASTCVATRVKALIVSICICVCTYLCIHIYEMLLHELAANARVVMCMKALIVSTRTCVCTFIVSTRTCMCTFIARCNIYCMIYVATCCRTSLLRVCVWPRAWRAYGTYMCMCMYVCMFIHIVYVAA